MTCVKARARSVAAASAGPYRFSDYWKLGLCLMVVFLALRRCSFQ